MNAVCFLAPLLLAAPGAAQEPPSSEAPTVEQLLRRAEASLAGIKEYTGRMRMQERFGEKLRKGMMEFKFQRPFKVYVRYLDPNPGQEAIFVEGWNDNEVRAHKGSFPDLTVNLDPRGHLAMADNHHPIVQFGLASTIKIASQIVRTALARGDGELTVSDGGVVHGKAVWRIAGRFPPGGTTVTTREGETLWDIATRTGQDMFVILYSNTSYGAPDDVDEGDPVFIPRYYASRVELLLDKERALPVAMSAWDFQDRLYERYEYLELRFDPGLSAGDFDPDNPAYHF